MLYKYFTILLLLVSPFFRDESYGKTEPKEVVIRAIEGLQFDIKKFSVRPGSEVRIRFINTDDMSHNLVITSPGAREEVVTAALNLGDNAMKMNFIPASSKVLWSVPVLSPGDTSVINFVAPQKPGVYPYVCTYPGHGYLMFGEMHVTDQEISPAAATVAVKKETKDPGHESHHTKSPERPFNDTIPYVSRVFIEGAGPAAIAVHLANGLSYCWDAGNCQLRFAWHGEFLDYTEFWKGHKDAYVKVLGDIFYRNETKSSLRIGSPDKMPVSKFKGYQLVNRYPEFHYFLDGTEVFETLHPTENGEGIVRTFRFPNNSKDIWFDFDSKDEVVFTTPGGKVLKDKVKLSLDKTRKFTMVITKKDTSELAYRVENIPTPPGLTPETGAIAFLPDGRLVACFLRGEVMIYTPKTRKWKLFANGLHEPLGIMVVNPSEFIVMHRPELTRIKDTNGDGQADIYETVSDEFGISGNYHEYNYGPLKDAEGNMVLAFNTASPRGWVMKESRGTVDAVGTNPPGQMFSPVPYRGWIMKLTPKGQLLPYASGLRSPNGLVYDPKGNLFATDNQGDWVGTSPLYHIKKDHFYGHPASLVWRKDWNKGDPFSLPVPALDSIRTKASVLFPHNIMANSITQPVFDISNGKFGPFAGQLFVGDMNQSRILRVMLEEVNGDLQGACIPFIDSNGLRKGNNRLAFSPDGSLWVGQAEHAWAGATGIQKIAFTGRQPADIQTMSLTKDGFDITFTQPMDEASLSNPENYQFKHYYYEYHKKYGSDQFDIQSIPVVNVKVSPDKKKVSLRLKSLKPGYIYELKLDRLLAGNGKPLPNKIICYTLNQLRK
ncbi:plastocyanin/azurin family copper-binding protein [Dyadobacter sp. CY323]|uniref:plastocyanin/azurin family copper-binding protein n=1 Tax=Dyadobacter sp. CY323 TaxID=2907302 RepID=UPI001F1D274D|nr:plastocyanin/azurin family copper-binding protein [Dyadobacter sp. CY323]MCE6989799.1 plastocyanin/azurin family copper-binding protein [Dyadobacter sp. CY323]